MKYNTAKKQNEKIAYITDKFLVIGIDVGSQIHYARAFDNRKIELSRKPFKFTNSNEGFEAFKVWASDLMKKYDKEFILAGMEPTGHYWFNLGSFISDNGMILTHVNPAAVKKSKELDDNDPSKNDRKDPKVIAGLVNDGRYSFPYMPEGDYADLRELMSMRQQTQEELVRLKNRIARWFSIYFPEYQDVYKDVYAQGGMMILKEHPLPEDIQKLGIDGILKIWRMNKLRGAGKRRAEKLYNTATSSIGRKEASKSARKHIQALLKELEYYQEKMSDLMADITDLINQIPNTDKLLEIKGVGIVSVAGFLSEVGEISRFDDPKEIQKLSGMSIVANSSGKHQGEHSISYRGRKYLRYTLYNLAISLVGRNPEFKSIHEYYTTRKNNPLKKMQSIIAVACKAIRVFYAILTKGTAYDGQKLLNDIVRPQTA